MKKGLAYLSILVAVFGICALSPARASSLISVDDLQAGDLFRGESFSAVYYYGVDGFRYVFPNDKIYFTWYENFDDVKWVSDADLATVQLGGNITYKPGVKMIKVTSSPTTYAIGSNGTLRWVKTAEIAEALYGSDWNKQIDDLPDGFFGNYTTGASIDTASSFDPDAEQADAYSIDEDKDLQEAAEIDISSAGYSDTSITIEVGTAIRWNNTDTENHSASDEDKEWGSGTISAGRSWARYFDESGTYEYYDRYDESNTGTIVVE